MSYILEALRRAQAEREQGQVPSLGVQHVAGLVAPPAARSTSWVWWVGGLLTLVLMAAALGWWRQSATEPATLPRPPSPSPSPPALPSVLAPVPTLPLVVSAPPSVPARIPAPLPTPDRTEVPALPDVPVAPAVPVVPPDRESRAPGIRTLRLNQLTPEQRRELPPLNVGGSISSEAAAARFVIIDGQVLREGDVVAPGLVLERIAPKSAWLRWRNTRIELVF